MKKIVIFSQVVLLILFFAILNNLLWIEEIVLLFLFPIILALIFTVLISLIRKIFKKSKLRFNFTFYTVIILQLILFVFIIWSIYPRKFAQNQVIEDVRNSIVLMEDIHPDLYATIEKDSLSGIVDSITNSLPQEISEPELNKIFASLVSNIKDGHTSLAIDNYIKRGSIFFRKVPPYKFRIHNNKIYIQDNYYIRDNIPIGSEILSINNKPAGQCIDEIDQFISYETVTFRNALLRLPVLWGMWNNFQDYKITFKTPDNKIENITTSSGLLANLTYLWEITAGFGFNSYSYKTLNDNIGYIELQAFSGIDNFRKFLKTTFSEIKNKKLNNLIIDIRRSSGGATSVSEEFMQYISPVAYTTFDSSWLKISDHLLSNYSLDTNKYIPGSLHFENRGIKELRDNPLRFTGNCFVLISGFCYSTSVDFPAMARYFNACKLVGSETGGRLTSFGSPATVSLPETGVVLKISRKKFLNVGGIKSEKGLIPDYIVQNSIKDNINGIDAVLDSTLALTRLN